MSGLPWIKLFGNLPDHPKSDLLEDILGVERAWTHVVELWLWVSRVRPKGTLEGLSDAVIAKRSGWAHDAETFVRALIEAGWLTEDRELAGWDEHQGAHVRKVERDRQRRKTKAEGDPGGEKKEPARNPRGTRATPEGEREREREREIPPNPPKGEPSDSDIDQVFTAFKSSATGVGKLYTPAAGLRKRWRTAIRERLDAGETLERLVRAAEASGARQAESAGAFRYKKPTSILDDGLADLEGGGDIPSADLHGNPIQLPAGYGWDSRDIELLNKGRVWLGDRWGSVPAGWKGAAA